MKMNMNMNMIKFLKLSLWVALSSLTLSVQAQKLPEPLLQAARKAVQSNPEVQARWHAFLAAGEQRSVARGGYFPQIDLTTSIGRERTQSPTIPGGDAGTYNFSSAQLTLNQMLFDGGFTTSEVKRLGYAKLTRYYELLDASEATALASVQAYTDVARGRELVQAAKDNYVLHRQTTLQLEERIQSGVSRGADGEQASGRLALAESSLLTELTSLHGANARYLNIMGESPPAVVNPLPDPFTLGALPASRQALMSEGLPGNPAVQAAVENLRAYEAGVVSGKAAFLPRIDARAEVSNEDNTGGVRGNTRVEGARLALDYNLFRGGADLARERGAVMQKNQASDLKDKACRDARQGLSIAYNDVSSLTVQLGYLDQHRLSTEKTREAYRNQFDIGQRTMLDLLDTQKEFFEASRSYINARYKQATAQARTLSGMGRLVAALGVRRDNLPSAQDAGQEHGPLSPEDLCPFEFPAEVKLEKGVKAVPKQGTGSYVVLLPSPDGSVGQVVVQGTSGERVLSQAQQATSLDGSTAPNEIPKEQLQRDFGSVMSARPPLPEHFVLYFKFGRTQLTAESATLLPKVMARLRARKVPDVSVIGHTDTVGKEAGNAALGLKRANLIAGQIRKQGLDNVDVSIESRGQNSLLVPTQDQVNEPRNRRVEITVR